MCRCVTRSTSGLRHTGTIGKIGLVQPEAAVVLHIHQLVQDEVRVFRLAIGRQAHDLVFAGVDAKAGVIGQRGIKQTKRVREVQLAGHLHVVPAADRYGGSGPFADAVHSQHHRMTSAMGVIQR